MKVIFIKVSLQFSRICSTCKNGAVKSFQQQQYMYMYAYIYIHCMHIFFRVRPKFVQGNIPQHKKAVLFLGIRAR